MLARERRDKDDRKPNTLAPLRSSLSPSLFQTLVVTGYINLQPFLHAATNRPFTVFITEVECLEAVALIGVLPSLAGGQGVVEECCVFCIVMEDAKFGSSWVF